MIPWPCSFGAVPLPTPHSSSTGIGCRNWRSRPGSITSSPSGFASRLAIFATILLVATPTVTASPTRSRHSRRSRSAIWRGEPRMCPSPLTSRNASSSDSPSTTGEVSRNTLNSSRLASV